jgi:hypothetical protein
VAREKLPRVTLPGRLGGSRRAPMGPPLRSSSVAAATPVSSGGNQRQSRTTGSSCLSPPSLPSLHLSLFSSPSPFLGGGAAQRRTFPVWIRRLLSQIQSFPARIWRARQRIRRVEGRLVHVDLAAAVASSQRWPLPSLHPRIWHAWLSSDPGSAAIRPSSAATMVPPVVGVSFPPLPLPAAALAGGCAPPSSSHTTTHY